MARSHVGKEVSDQEARELLAILERVGRVLQSTDVLSITEGLPVEIRDDKEKITRFLLLVALLDQQAESPTARETAVRIHAIFGDALFFKPQSVLIRLNSLAGLQEGYKISPAIGRVLPRFGWIVLRVGSFLIYEMMLNSKKLSEELARCDTPRQATAFLHSNHLLNATLRAKATRMFISWVGHPVLSIDISQGKWRVSDFEMPVDGHVGKIFSRTGLVSEVLHERKQGKGERWNVIQASQMRPLIQAVVQDSGRDCIMVDHGAFRIGFNCCPDNLQGIACGSCPKEDCEIASVINCARRCPLEAYCKRNLTWRAY